MNCTTNMIMDLWRFLNKDEIGTDIVLNKTISKDIGKNGMPFFSRKGFYSACC